MLRLFTACTLFFLATAAATAQSRLAPNPRIRRAVDRGPLAPDRNLSRITVSFRRSPEQAAALDRLLADQQDPASSAYHRWLTPDEFGERFGLPRRRLDRVLDWLRGAGFTVESVARGLGSVVVSGSAAAVERAFHAELHRYQEIDRAHFAPSAPPAVPGDLAPDIRAVRGLDDYYLDPPRRLSPLSNLSDGSHALAPGDVANIYRFVEIGPIESPQWRIAVVGQSAIDLADVRQFRRTFQLSDQDPEVVLVGNDPGRSNNGDFLEGTADVEWAGALARSVQVVYVYADNVLDASAEVVDRNLAQVLSFSYGVCEPLLSDDDAEAIRDLARQANAQGITWIAASGDSGAAGCDAHADAALSGRAVSFPASLPEVTAVGGTRFDDSGGGFWLSLNNPDLSSTFNYIPEVAWNETSSGSGIWASGGGASARYPRPEWQAAPGVPDNGARSVPDVSFAAGANHDPYIVVADGALYRAGGTSLAAPVFSVVIALAGRTMTQNGGGAAGLGNVNPTLYQLASDTFYGPLLFHDIQTGDNRVPCMIGTADCADGAFGYAAGPGYDQVTGLGSIYVYPFLYALRLATATTLTTSAAQVSAGDPVTLTASVRDLSGNIPTGTVSFWDRNFPVSLYVPLDSFGRAVAKPVLSGGPHSIVARYDATPRFRISTSPSVTVFVLQSTPPFPTLLTPADRSTDIAVDATLSWTAPPVWASYDVYFGTVSPPPYWGPVGAPSFRPSSLIPGTTYYWKVVARNPSGSAESPTWSFTTHAGAAFTLHRFAANLYQPRDLAWDSAGRMYVSAEYVYRIELDGTKTVIAGSRETSLGDGGPAVQAHIETPTGLAFDPQGNLYIAEAGRNRIRRVGVDGIVSTIAGDGSSAFSGDGGPSTAARVYEPRGLAADASGVLYFADMRNHCIRRIRDGVIDSVAGRCGVDPTDDLGDGGPALSAGLSWPQGVALDAPGNLYIADTEHHRIRKVTDGVITSLASVPAVRVAVGPSGEVYFTDQTGHVGMVVDGEVTMLAGGGESAPADGAAGTSAALASTVGLTLDAAGKVYFSENTGVWTLTAAGAAAAPAIASATPLVAGSLASLYGRFGLETPRSDSTAPLALGGLSVEIDGVAAPVAFASADQAVVQVPWELAGRSSVAVTARLNGKAGPSSTLAPVPYAPMVLEIRDSLGRLPDSANPATAGTILQIACAGLGPVPAAPATGAPASLITLTPTAATPTVTVGGLEAAILFSGLAPGAVGQYQINARVPSGVKPGPAVAVVLSIGGALSGAVTIALR
jgi:uncharacterized protein (TIGR03437 family)